MRQAHQWKCRNRVLVCGPQTLIMGILNVTPDSFSDGGLYRYAPDAIAHALDMEADGAAIIDIGGESTRPGAPAVSAAEETDRVLPVIRDLARKCRCALSIDTTKASVARAALEAGCHIVNDVSAGTADEEMLPVVREHGAGFILMHMQGTPRTMQQNPSYENVVEDVRRWLVQRAGACVAAGLDRATLALDPGIGFGKTVEHNLDLLAGLDRLSEAGYPVVVGVSRKSFLGALTGEGPGGRLAGSLSALSYAITRGAGVVRVHDVKESCQAARVVDILLAHEESVNGCRIP
ncbi:MAG: dihydropteroate synthase [Kiritimatiellia bacterium]